MNEFPSSNLYVAREFAQVVRVPGKAIGTLPPALAHPLWFDPIRAPLWDDVCYASITGRSWLRIPGHDKADEGFFLSQKIPVEIDDALTASVVQQLGLPARPPRHIHASVRSGERSMIVMNDSTLYRLKGATYDHIPLFVDERYISGGQLASEGEREREGCAAVNAVFTDAGLTPVAVPIGAYQFEQREAFIAKLKRVTRDGPEWDCLGRAVVDLETSVYEIRGDTRLDEFLTRVEREIGATEYNEVRGLFPSQHVRDKLEAFYYACGEAAGAQLRLLHDNGLTWSDHPERTNSHIGNLVLYPNADSVSLGMVDFDRYLPNTAPSSVISAQQEAERAGLLLSAMSNEISTRPLYATGIKESAYQPFRMWFVSGARDGYDSGKPKPALDVNLTEIITSVFESTNTDPNKFPSFF